MSSQEAEKEDYFLQEKEENQDEENQDKMENPQQQQQFQHKKKGPIKHGQSGLGALVALKQYNIYLSKKVDDEILCVPIEIPQTWKISNVIQCSLEQFNEKLFKLNSSFYLSDQIQNWAVCAAKKNGESKEEPNFAHEILVSDTGSIRFQLIPFSNDENCFIDVNEQENQNEQIQNEQQLQKEQQQHFELKQGQKQQNPSLDKYNNSLVRKNPKNDHKSEQPDYEEDTGGCLCFKSSKKKRN